MNTKGIKFLAVLAVLAMAFAAFAVIAPAEESDATEGVLIANNKTVVAADAGEGQVVYAANMYVGTASEGISVNADVTGTIALEPGATILIKKTAANQGTLKIIKVNDGESVDVTVDDAFIQLVAGADHKIAADITVKASAGDDGCIVVSTSSFTDGSATFGDSVASKNVGFKDPKMTVDSTTFGEGFEMYPLTGDATHTKGIVINPTTLALTNKATAYVEVKNAPKFVGIAYADGILTLTDATAKVSSTASNNKLYATALVGGTAPTLVATEGYALTETTKVGATKYTGYVLSTTDDTPLNAEMVYVTNLGAVVEADYAYNKTTGKFTQGDDDFTAGYQIRQAKPVVSVVYGDFSAQRTFSPTATVAWENGVAIADPVLTWAIVGAVTGNFYIDQSTGFITVDSSAFAAAGAWAAQATYAYTPVVGDATVATSPDDNGVLVEAAAPGYVAFVGTDVLANQFATLPEAVAAAVASGQTIYLAKDYSLTTELDLKGQTLDLNGHILTITGAGAITSKDPSTAEAKTAFIKYNGINTKADSAAIVIAAASEATIAIQNVKITLTSVGTYPIAAISNLDNGAKLKSVEFTAERNMSYFYAISSADNITLDTCTMNNGIVSVAATKLVTLTKTKTNVYLPSVNGTPWTLNLKSEVVGTANNITVYPSDTSSAVKDIIVGSDLSVTNLTVAKKSVVATIYNQLAKDVTVGKIIMGSNVNGLTLTFNDGNNKTITAGLIEDTIVNVAANTTVVASGESGKFTMTSTGVALDSYAGSVSFNFAAGASIDLKGDNIVTVTGQAFVTGGVGAMTIGSEYGVGSLTIVAAESEDGAVNGVISSGGLLTITSTPVSVAIPAADASKGIVANGLSLYETELTVNMGLNVMSGSIGISTTAEITSQSSTIDVTAGLYGVFADNAGEGRNITLQKTDLVAAAGVYAVKAAKLSASSASSVDASNIAMATNGNKAPYSLYVTFFDVQSDSTIDAYSMYVTGADNSKNTGTIYIDTDFVLAGTNTFTNNGALVIDGTMLVIGNMVNGENGTITNNGIIASSKYIAPGTGADPVVLTKHIDTADSAAWITSIDFVYEGVELMANTTYYGSATIVLGVGGDVAIPKDHYTAYGIYTVNSDGNIISFVGTITTTVVDPSGVIIPYTAAVNATVITEKNSTTGKYDGFYWNVTTAGIVIANDDVTQITISNTDSSAKTESASESTGRDSLTNGKANANGSISMVGGLFENLGTLTLNKAYTAGAPFMSGGTFNGAINANNAFYVTDGTINGNITAKGEVNSAGIINGNITASANVTISGTIVGDITTAKQVTISVSKMDGSIIHSAKYRKAVTTPSSTDKDAEFTNKLTLKTLGGTTVIDTKNAKDATETVVGTPGYIQLTSYGTPSKDKESFLTIAEGIVTATGATIPADYTVEQLASTTFSIDLGQELIVNGILKIDDGATFNVRDTEAGVYTYGFVTSDVKFYEAGATYYCAFAFAIGNIGEGMTLELTADGVEIAKAIDVKKDVTIIIAANKTLTLKNKTVLTMQDGAKFVLMDGSAINMEVGAIVSGLYVYDDKDAVVLDAVKIKGASKITNAANGTEKDMSVTAQFDKGTLTVSDGIVIGTITLDHDATTSIGELIISEDATFKGIFTDLAYELNVCAGTVTTIDGTLELTQATTINGTVGGLGEILITKDLTFATTAVAAILVTDGTNGFDLLMSFDYKVAADKPAGWGDPNAVKFTPATAVAKFGVTCTNVDNTFKLGAVGTITAVGDVSASNFTVPVDVALYVPEDATLTVVGGTADTAANASIVATGFVVNNGGTLNYKIADDAATASYGYFYYQISYVEDGATVYTALATGVTNAEEGDLFYIDKDLDIGANKMVVPNGVVITVADEKKITVPNNGMIIIGEAATTLGSEPGMIIGDVLLTGTGVFIAYAGTDLTGTTIYGGVGVPAVSSDFIIDQTLYATVFARAVDTVDYAATPALKAALKPAIEGYTVSNFVCEEIVDAHQYIGAGNFFAVSSSFTVKVTFTTVAGIDYYVGNTKVNMLDAPMSVDYGAVITAKAASGYTGTALVNGQAYITVDNTVSKVTGSGVAPAPTPEPTPEEKSEWTITTILLVILVVLIAILVIIMVLRMNRS